MKSRESPSGRIYIRKHIKVTSSYNSISEWELNQRGEDWWISHGGNVYNPNHFSTMLDQLLEIKEYLVKNGVLK